MNKEITNLVDYVFGIEVGLDVNARKNRGGKQMEKAVAQIFEDNKIIYTEQVKHTNFSELKSLGKGKKEIEKDAVANSYRQKIKGFIDQNQLDNYLKQE